MLVIPETNTVKNCPVKLFPLVYNYTFYPKTIMAIDMNKFEKKEIRTKVILITMRVSQIENSQFVFCLALVDIQDIH